MKAIVGAFNKEEALVGAFSVIVQLHRLIVYSTDEDVGHHYIRPPGHWDTGTLWAAAVAFKPRPRVRVTNCSAMTHHVLSVGTLRTPPDMPGAMWQVEVVLCLGVSPHTVTTG